jgi:acyl-CoA thioesterase
MSAAPSPFDQAIALVPTGEDAFRGSTSPAYANMIGPYGGITAAQALHAVLLHPHRLGEPVAFTVNFAAPVADGDFDLVARPVRTNRSTQHWTVEMRQGDGVVLTATAVTGLHRETFAPQEARMPTVPRPQDVPAMQRPGRIAWVNRYAMRFVHGGLPATWDGSDAGDSLTQLWMRDDPARPVDHASLAALCDVFFPRVWRRRARIVPMGTVSMSVYFHACTAELQATGDGWLFGQVRGSGFARGYFDHHGHLWNEAGTLLATTHQVVYYKE